MAYKAHTAAQKIGHDRGGKQLIRPNRENNLVQKKGCKVLPVSELYAQEAMCGTSEVSYIALTLSFS